MRIVYHHRTRASDAQGVHILEMVNAFRESGHEVELVSLVDTEKRPAATAEDESKEAWWKTLMKRLPFFAEFAQLGYNALGIALLARRLRNRADFIYERYSLFTFAGVVTAKLFRIPLVLEVNSPLALEQHQHKEIRSFRLGNWLERQICNGASVVVVVSTPLQRILANNGVRQSRFLLLPNGINPKTLGQGRTTHDPAALPGVNGRVVIGFVGWFRSWHGLEMLVDAFHNARLKDRAVLMLVGDGPARPDLENLVAKHSLQDAVIFTGPVPHAEVGNYIRCFDVAMQPAANPYCCPMKIIEYMGMSKAIVAPRQENIQELLQENTEAIFFRSGDQTELETCLQRVAGDAELRASLGAAARRAIDTRRLLWTANADAVVSRVQEIKKR